MSISSADPHAGAIIHTAGSPLGTAGAALIMVHGRGASAEDILDLARPLPERGVAYLAPQAAGHTWYPHRFIEPIERNEPHLSSALAMITAIVGMVHDAGIPGERIALLGFSQGACLVSEWAVRNPARYGGVIALSGGLIGPWGTVWPDRGSLDGTPVFLGCSDVDSHIPAERVVESATRFRELGGVVDLRLYPGLGHTINRDELSAIRAIVDAMTGAGASPSGP